MNPNQPVVSVIVPVYNAGAFLRRTLDCICGQTLRDIEIILVDDGSTDDSRSIQQEYATRDSRIILLQQEHEYAGAARNKGMAIARGKYLSFLDADDLFESTMLEKMVARAEEVGADVVVCRCDIFRSEKDCRLMNWQIRDRYLKSVDRKCFSLKSAYPLGTLQAFIGWAWDKLFRADFVRKGGFKFGPSRHGNDGPFVFPAIAAADRISIVDESLVKYRQSDTQISNSSNLSRNPSACCTSVSLIYNELRRLEASAPVMKSFYLWLANYIGWNYGQYSPESRLELKQFIRRNCKAMPYLSQAPRIVLDADCKLVYTSAKANIDTYCGMLNPAISVIVPTYNAAPFLHEALDSLLSQTFTDWEAICVNDGSTDNSLEILLQYAEKDSRFRILDGPNGGYGCAMNRGMDAAKGNYMAILEPDDYLPADAYEILYAVAEKHKADISKGLVLRFTGDGDSRVFKKQNVIPDVFLDKVTTPRKNREIFRYNMNTWTCLYRMDFLRKHGIRHVETPGASYQDNSFYLLSFGHAESLVCHAQPVYCYREDNQNSSTLTAMSKIHAHREVYEYIRSHFEKHPEIWDQMQGAFMLKRFFSHNFIWARIDSSKKREYLTTFRKELQSYKMLDDCLLTKEMKWARNTILNAPETFLQCNGKSKYRNKEFRFFGFPIWKRSIEGDFLVCRILNMRYKVKNID